MGGRIWVESAVGEGTAFHFTARFGVAPESARSGTPVAEAFCPPETGTLDGNGRDAHPAGGLRILLAEDNVINRALATALLERRGHSLVHAANGREAVAAAANEPFDLIFMDVQMPEMDGFEATGHIRESERATGQHTPIAAMTAHAMAGDRERCLAAGTDDYISKPLEKAELLALLARISADRHPECHPQLLPGCLPRPAAPVPPPIFNRATLLEQFDGNEALLQKLIGLFRENTPHLLAHIRDAIARRHAPDLACSAHALLSSLGAFGAHEARRLTLQLEVQAPDDEFETIAQTFSALEREAGNVSAALVAFTSPATQARS